MIKKLLVPILKICKSKFIKIEDPRFVPMPKASRIPDIIPRIISEQQIGTKLVDWQEKSNWTKAMEAQGLSEDERKKVMDKAQEDLKKEQVRAEDAQEQQEPVKEELDKAA